MRTAASDVRGAAGRRARLAWIGWALWAALIFARCYVQLWSALRQPLGLAALFGAAARQTLYCAVLGGVAALAAVAIAYVWRRGSRAAGSPSEPWALLAAAVMVPVWFRGRAAVVAALSTVHVPHLPAFGEAAARAASGVCGAALVVLAAVMLGRIVVSALGLADAAPGERRLLAVTLGFGVVAVCSSALAFAGVYRPSVVALLIAGALAAGAARAWRRPHGPSDPRDAAPNAVSAARPAGLEVAWLALTFVALSFGLVAALAPETEYDALWYHLNFPRLWLDAGRPVDLVQEFPSLYPMTWELVYGAGLATGGIVAAKLLHFVCLFVLAGTLATACRRYFPSTSPYAAVGLMVTAPTILWESTTAYNDVAVAMFTSVACYALARFAETARSAWLLAAAIEFGLAASTKHLGLVVAAAAGAVWLWDGWRRKVPFRRLLKPVLVIGIACLALAMPWYLRAWYGSGNPFFPELYGVFGGGPPARWDAAANHGLSVFKAHFGLGHGLRSLMRLPWDVTVHSALFGGSFGPLWLMLVPACLLGTVSRRAAGMLALGTLAYVAVWASPVSSFQLRFLVPLGGAFALLAADGWQRVVGDDPGVGAPARRLAGLVLIGIACLTLPPFTPLQEADRIGYNGWLTHVLRAAPVAVVTGRESEAEYLARSVPSFRVWQYANAHLPADASVLTFTGGDNLYSRVARYPHDSVLARPAVWTATSDGDALATLHRLGIEYAIFDRRLLPRLESSRSPIAGDRLQRACATLYEDARYRLCRLPSVSDASSIVSSRGSVQ